MSDVNRACLHLQIDPQSVVKHRVEGDELVLLSDQGIAGTKKYRVPLSQLEQAPEPEPDDEPESYACEGCGREFDSERGLSVHQRYCAELSADEEE